MGILCSIRTFVVTMSGVAKISVMNTMSDF